MKNSNRLPSMSERLSKITEEDNADQFGEEISKINDWFAKEYDAAFSFEWNGKELKVLDADKKEKETINRVDLSKKIDGFPEKISESSDPEKAIIDILVKKFKFGKNKAEDLYAKYQDIAEENADNPEGAAASINDAWENEGNSNEGKTNEAKKLPSSVIKYCGKYGGTHYFITKESGIYQLSDGEVREVYHMLPSELPAPDLTGHDVKTKGGAEATVLYSKGSENLIYFKKDKSLTIYSRNEMKEIFETNDSGTSSIVKENRLSKFSDIVKNFINENSSEPIKIVVKDEHTLGYIRPENSKNLEILHDSILKGAPSNYNKTGSVPIGSGDKIRLATKKDFDDFRVAWSKEYENENEYTYDHK